MIRFATFPLAFVALATAGAALAQGAPADGTSAKPRAEMTRAQVEQRSKAAFARMDANNDGIVNAADREARRQAMFDRLDTDKNGSISREEFAAASANSPRRQGATAGATPRAARPDMTAQQFTEAALSRFDKADTNRDGVLSAEERRAAGKAMRGMRAPRQG